MMSSICSRGVFTLIQLLGSGNGSAHRVRLPPHCRTTRPAAELVVHRPVDKEGGGGPKAARLTA